ncbi:MAG TPA: HAD-IG family 5'-nucleotidase, partial [Polyangiaceae bacterium]
MNDIRPEQARAEAQQLALPLPGVAAETTGGVGIPRSERVFVNRNLRLSTIDWIGFDMDYTLAVYRQDQMDALSVELTAQRMIQRGYPEYLRQLSYDTRFPIRGLLIDRRHGHVLKMDRHKVIYKGYHGMRRLGKEEIQELYHRRIRPHTLRYHWIDSLFALSEVTSFAAILDAMEKRNAHIDYGRLFNDVRASIDEAHADGTVYSIVTSDLPRFVDRDLELARTLHKLRSAGKKLFFLTNSPWHYCDAMMTYLLNDSMPEYPNWQNYFDVVICSANKPVWFKEGRPLLLREGGARRAVTAPLERGAVYEAGNLREFERLLGLRGSNVLYVGDHIYGDILRSKKESSWRTAMIIQELDAEIAAHEACTTDMARQRELEEAHEHLEDELRFYQLRYKATSRKPEEQSANASEERARVKRALDRVRAELRANQSEHESLSERVDQRFHPYWGSLLKEGNEMSMFGLQVELYADIYTRRVSCLKA